ncbi:MAG: S8 family serine peptidase [Alphaproteobacteria bacterium]|nr:S8 family serine peptidase [Alphaproteobacteria bacterium]
MLASLLAAFAAPPAWLTDPGRPLPPVAVEGPGGTVAALVRADGSALAARGLDVRRRADGTFRGGLGWVSVQAGRATIASLVREGFEVMPDRRIDLGPYPTNVTGPLVGAPAMRARPEGPTGAGITIGNIDSHIDVTHPHFFRADAGTFRWLDVDGDGELTPGVDGLDRDGDGRIAPDEALEELEAFAWRWNPDTDGFSYDQSPGVLDPRRDWLYLDLNGNGVRDSGRPGWNDDDPGMAEPTFVPDDVDGDGVIEPGERVWQLGSSVIRAIYWDGSLFARGQNLSAYDRQVEEDRSHGTAVSGILTGGQLPAQRQFGGLAPDAELVFVSRYEVEQLSDLLDFIEVAEGLEVDVLLHEYAPWLGYSLDGTDPIEQAVDQLAEQGMVQVCAAGNLADAGKHGVLRNVGGRDWQTEVIVDESVGSLWLEWHYPGPADRVSCRLQSEAFAFDLPPLDTQLEDGAFLGYLTHDTSDAGNSRGTFAVWRPDGQALPEGEWVLTCDVPEPLDVYLIDGSGWGRGSVFRTEDRSKTMGLPATAEHCIAVAAYSGRFAYEGETLHDLRSWSSRGPALGGQKSMDVAAPDDAYAPSAWFAPNSDGSYTLFGGTSGAAPHVAALAALMKQAEPGLSGVDIRQQLVDGADIDGQVVPGNGWGAGRVDGYRALFGEAAPVAPAPVALDVDWRFLQGGAQVTVTGAPDLRWDFGYDGVIDATGPVHTVKPGDVVRIDAYVDGWRVGGTVLDGSPAAYEPVPRGCATAPGRGWAGWTGLVARRR